MRCHACYCVCLYPCSHLARILKLHCNYTGRFTTLRANSVHLADPSRRAFYRVGLRPLAYWDRRFESRWGYWCFPLVSVVFCQVEFSASGWSLFQRNSTECGVSECDLVTSTRRGPWPSIDVTLLAFRLAFRLSAFCKICRLVCFEYVAFLPR
jgi:hypothetical protein